MGGEAGRGRGAASQSQELINTSSPLSPFNKYFEYLQTPTLKHTQTM